MTSIARLPEDPDPQSKDDPMITTRRLLFLTVRDLIADSKTRIYWWPLVPNDECADQELGVIKFIGVRAY